MAALQQTISHLVLLVILVSCVTVDPTTSPIPPTGSQAVSPLEEPPATVTHRDPPRTPATGLASAYGRVLDTSRPASGMVVRLAEVYRSGTEGAFLLDDAVSPATITDEQGYFWFTDVEPREYVVVVGDVHVSYEIIAEASGSARVWELTADTITDIGVVEVTLD